MTYCSTFCMTLHYRACTLACCELYTKLTLQVLLLGTGGSVAGMPLWELLGRHTGLALGVEDLMVVEVCCWLVVVNGTAYSRAAQVSHV